MAKLVIGGVTYNSAPSSASNLPYDNSDTSLSANTVQDAIDELADGGGTTDYDNLSDKPQVNGVTLSGDKDSQDLGVVWQGTQAQYDALTTIDPNTVYFITDATGTVLATVATTGSYNDLSDKPDLTTKMDKANPTGTGSLSLNRKSGTPTGQYSTTEGQNCEASGTWAHAEGYNTVASRGWAHAENNETKASGTASHAEGAGTIANHHAQHVFGTFNVADTSVNEGNQKGTYIEIVGNGADKNSRSNARTLDWQGNEVLAGDLTIKGNMSVYDNLNGTVTTQTVDGITWTIVKQGRLYELHAVIPVQSTTPTMWGGLYVYRNTTSVYALPITLTEKLCDISYGTGAFAFWQVMYTDLGAYYKSRTVADIARPTAASGTSIDVHKYIRGYV